MAGMYGHQFPNGSWDGVVGDLSTRRVDISNLALTHLPSRYEVQKTRDYFATGGRDGPTVDTSYAGPFKNDL